MTQKFREQRSLGFFVIIVDIYKFLIMLFIRSAFVKSFSKMQKQLVRRLSQDACL